MRAVPLRAADFVAKLEALRLTAYPDPRSPRGIELSKAPAKRKPGWETLPGDPWTIGYGHTGTEVVEGLTITKASAQSYLFKDLTTAARRLEKRVGAIAVSLLTVNQYIALLSFVFNLGTGDPKKPEWSIWKALRAKDFDQVPSQLTRFVYAGGKKVQGLVNRRAAEVALWSTDEPGSVDESPPSSVTRAIDTPPAPMAKPLTQSKSFITTAITAAATAPVAVKQVSDTLAPYASQSDTVAKIVAGLATIAAILAVLALVFQWMKHKGANR